MVHHGANQFHTACLIMFCIGQFIHAWLQARELIRAKTNGVTNYRQYWDYRGPEVVGRIFGCYLLYGAWQTGFLATLIGELVPGAEALMKAHPHPIPFNQFTAGAFGFLGDSILKGLTRLALKNKTIREFFGFKNLPAPSDDSIAEKGINESGTN